MLSPISYADTLMLFAFRGHAIRQLSLSLIIFLSLPL